MQTDYDVIVIGAGIQGAAVAQATSAAGYKTLVLEQCGEPACGTSSRSSKLIHGGLRYLETMQFSLVRECLVERKRLLQNAPHLVKLVPFYIPVYKTTMRRPWKIMLGLMLYSLISRKLFRRLPKSEWDQLEGLDRHELDAVFCYFDGQTDDAKLTRAVLASAKSLGACVHFNASFESCQIHSNHCLISYRQSEAEQQISVSAQCVVNATGPWIGEVAGKISPSFSTPQVELVQGTHIEIQGQAKQGLYYLEAPQDQRAVFVMPWKDHILVGTTEASYQGDPAEVQPLEEEKEYLLGVYNHYFKSSLSKKDIINAFAGLRVLPMSDGSAFSRPRDTLIISDNEDKPRVVSLYGGKLTAQRSTAADVLKQLQKTLPKRQKIADTRELRLP